MFASFGMEIIKTGKYSDGVSERHLVFMVGSLMVQSSDVLSRIERTFC